MAETKWTATKKEAELREQLRLATEEVAALLQRIAFAERDAADSFYGAGHIAERQIADDRQNIAALRAELDTVEHRKMGVLDQLRAETAERELARERGYRVWSELRSWFSLVISVLALLVAFYAAHKK